jgi:uncharacterized membrane protein
MPFVAYGVLAVLILVIDMIWLGFIARDFYKSALADTMLEKPVLLAALAFYVLYPLGLMIFAVNQTLDTLDWQKAALYGALFGFFAYMTYDLSNLATLKVFPLKLALTDIAWGTFISGFSCGATVYLLKLFR